MEKGAVGGLMGVEGLVAPAACRVKKKGSIKSDSVVHVPYVRKKGAGGCRGSAAFRQCCIVPYVRKKGAGAWGEGGHKENTNGNKDIDEPYCPYPTYGGGKLVGWCRWRKR